MSDGDWYVLADAHERAPQLWSHGTHVEAVRSAELLIQQGRQSVLVFDRQELKRFWEKRPRLGACPVD